MQFSVQHTGDRYNNMIQHASTSCMNILQYVTVFHFRLNNNLLNINNYNTCFLMFVERWLKRKKFEFCSCHWQKYWWFVAFRENKTTTETSSSGHPFVFQYQDHCQKDMFHCTRVFTLTSLAWNSGFREYWKVSNVHGNANEIPNGESMILVSMLIYQELCMIIYTCTIQIHIYIYTCVSIWIVFVYHHVTNCNFFNKQSRKNLF